ncbi:mechanosensitive ion channel family protein [Apibacter adventoris]|uniref:mechanosensitive ion channel family protein n=1 Tax=Apibacter adventoris TaxID=1679466 RepID=UPI000CF649A5|nr:mechanosensitive ion channel domain-containing protein [Apibacter adventoris]PQL94335.1 mechanosensitive ion channel protein [Apibacter adventoris]
MDGATNLKLENQNTIIDNLHNYIANHFPESTILFSQIFIKVLIVLSIFLLLDWFQRKVLLKIVQRIIPKTKNIWMNTFMKKNVFTSFFHLLPLGICYCLVPVIFYHHPQSFHILDLVFSIFLIIFLSKFIICVIDSFTEIKNRDKSYRTVAVKTFSELIKILIILFSGFIIISILFNLTSSKIFTFLGAIMAVILLVFRDPILGLVTGINIAGSKQIKVGDWISIPKYGTEGSVKEINLVTAKIQNLDKTISTVPTYDLISTEVKNHEPMKASHTRRIKRSVLFDFDSIKFVDESLINKLMKISLLKDYLLQIKGKSNLSDLKNSEGHESRHRITNLEIFRHYMKIYLLKNPRISTKDTILVRHLEPTVYGLPLEIYCFANTSVWLEYEEIQANIFEHLIALSSEFELKIILTTAS